MGVGHLDIGIGQGGAQVFGHNPAIQQFGQMLADRKAKQEQDNKFLNEQLASNYDPSSLRNDADKQSYLKQYGDIRQKAIDIENEKNPQKKALGIAEVRQQLGNLGAYADSSKKQGAIEKQLAMEFMKNPDHYQDDSIDKYKKGLNLEWNHSDVINNPSQVERRVDPDKMDAEYKKFKQSQIEPTQWDNGTKKVYTFDGKKKQVIQQNRGLPIDGDNGAYEMMLHYASANPNFKKGLRDRYPEIDTGNPQMDLGLRTRKYMHDMGDEKGFYDKPKEISMEGEAPQRWSLAQQWNLVHYGTPNPPGTSVSMEASPIVQKYIAPMINGGLPELQKFADLAPKGQFRDGEEIKPDIVNGYHVLHIPDQVDIDTKIQKKNEDNKKIYEQSPEKKGKTLGMFGGTPVPWEQSERYKLPSTQGGHADPYKVKQKGEDVTLDPNDKADYGAKAIQTAKRLKIPMTDINTELGKKGGKGLRQEFQGTQNKEHTEKKESGTKLIHVRLKDGREGNVPLNKWTEFLKNNPDAQRVDK
jgi:hypothetical protein